MKRSDSGSTNSIIDVLPWTIEELHRMHACMPAHMKATMTAHNIPLNGPTLRVITQSLGLHRAIDLAHLTGRNERTVKRWFTGERPIPPDLATTVRTWQQEASDQANATLDQIDAAFQGGETVIQLTRYATAAALHRHRPRSITTHSAETWDAHLGRIIAALHDQGIPYTIHTTTD